MHDNHVETISYHVIIESVIMYAQQVNGIINLLCFLKIYVQKFNFSSSKDLTIKA